MGIATLLLFAAISVRAGHGDLRQGCAVDDPIIATLPAGSPVHVQFAINDGSDCYKVSGVAEGYLHGEGLVGLEEFELGLRAAPAIQQRSKAATVGSEEAALAPEVARALAGVLEEAHSRISAELGCAVPTPINAILQSRPAYLRSIDAVEWSAGLYDGKIRVALPESDLRKVLAHEMVHACLASVSTRWPAWFQEGVARKLSGDTLSAGEAAHLRQLAAAHSLPRLENIAQSWSRMSAQHAQTANALALAAVEMLSDLRTIVRDPGQLPAITAELDRRLGL